MVGRRVIDWARADSKLRQERLAARSPVREERLRVSEPMAAWRGHSGTRYVFRILAVEACPPPPLGSVLAAVDRSGAQARLIRADVGMGAEAFEDWRRDAVEEGATEIQLHTLTTGRRAAERLVEDLGFEARAFPAHGLGF